MRKDLSELVVGDFKDVGNNTINIDFALKNWTKMWRIFEREGEFRLVVGVRENSENRRFKSAISSSQAFELIKKANLTMENGVFGNSLIWKLLK